MTDTVGVHISETQITAVRFDASSTQPPRVVVLGGSDGGAGESRAATGGRRPEP